MTVPTWPVAPTTATESPESEMRVMAVVLECRGVESQILPGGDRMPDGGAFCYASAAAPNDTANCTHHRSTVRKVSRSTPAGMS